MKLQTKLEAAQEYLSDFHKDTFGTRPRGERLEYLLSLNYEELTDEYDKWSEIQKLQRESEALEAKASYLRFESIVKKTICLGAAKNREEALRTMFEHKVKGFIDIEQIVWELGFVFTEEGEALVEELTDIFYN